MIYKWFFFLHHAFILDDERVMTYEKQSEGRIFDSRAPAYLQETSTEKSAATVF